MFDEWNIHVDKWSWLDIQEGISFYGSLLLFSNIKFDTRSLSKGKNLFIKHDNVVNFPKIDLLFILIFSS